MDVGYPEISMLPLPRADAVVYPELLSASDVEASCFIEFLSPEARRRRRASPTPLPDLRMVPRRRLLESRTELEASIREDRSREEDSMVKDIFL